jgi:hypothetical protein
MRLERECQRSIELVWLGGRLMPEVTTIADSKIGPLRSLPLRQIDLPGDTKSIGKPSKSRAEAIVGQWHLHVTAIGKPFEGFGPVSGPLKRKRPLLRKAVIREPQSCSLWLRAPSNH